MRRSPLIIVAFLLCLYIVPTLFISSYDRVATPAQQNIGKDFVTADDWNEVTSAEMEFDTPAWYNVTSAEIQFQTPEPPSSQSITSFSETLPDDVLYYPDGFGGDIQVAVDGDTGEYVKSQLKDSDYVVTGDTTTDELYYSSVSIGVERFDYAIYGFGDGTGTVKYYDGGWQTLETITSEDWYNGSVSPLDPMTLQTERIISFELSATGGHDLYIDYAEIQVYYLTRYTSESYGESFSDISEWVEDSFTDDDDTSTDGDIATFETGHDAGSVNDYWYSNTPNITISGTYYVELRFMIETTLASLNLYFTIFTEDDRAGDSQASPLRLEQYADSIDTWYTYKWPVTLETVECVGFHSRTYDVTRNLVVDDLRISKADETGWQHDGSTTEGTENEGSAGWVLESSSDGDVLQFDWTRTGGVDTAAWQQINIDPTTTSAEIELDYYPMWALRWRVTESTNASFSALQVYTDDTRLAINAVTSTDETTSWDTIRYNMGASTDTGIAGNAIRFYVGNSQDTATFTLEVEWTKFHAIANYTITQGAATTTTDILFVEDGALNVTCPTAEDHYFILDYDPLMDVDTSIFELFSINATVNTQWFAEYVGSWQSWKVDKLTGVLESGTMTDFKLLLDGSTIISAIEFLDSLSFWWDISFGELTIRVKDWAYVVSAVLAFLVDLYTYEWFFILLGLIMIPVSTLYLARGGKDDLSRDKTFLFLIIFLFGWAFFLGGIL